LLLLCAQRPATISRLTIDDIDITDGTVELRLGRESITRPEPLSRLLRDLVTVRRGRTALGEQGTSPGCSQKGNPAAR
jgi:hypothetical protein